MSQKSYLGKGTIYLEEIGGTTGLLSIGNCSALTLTFNEDKKEQKDYEEAGGAVTASVSRISSVTGSITALNFEADNLALATRGLTTAVAATPVSNEAHTARLGALIPFDKLPDPSQSITVTNVGASVTYVVDVDYEIKNGGVRILEAPATITDGLAIEVNYTPLVGTEIETLTASGKQYRLVFDGLNEADSGKPASIEAFKTNFNPLAALDLIADDFGEMAMTFDILKDTTKSGATISKFIKIKTAD